MTNVEIKTGDRSKSQALKRNLCDLLIMLAVFAFLILLRNRIFWPAGNGGIYLETALVTNVVPCYLIFYICFRRLKSPVLYLFISLLWAGLTFAELRDWGAMNSSRGPLVVDGKRTALGIYYEVLSPTVWVILFAIILVTTKSIWPLFSKTPEKD